MYMYYVVLYIRYRCIVLCCTPSVSTYIVWCCTSGIDGCIVLYIGCRCIYVLCCTLGLGTCIVLYYTLGVGVCVMC